MTPYEQALGNSGMVKLPFNREKSPAEQGSSMAGWVGKEKVEKRENRAHGDWAKHRRKEMNMTDLLPYIANKKGPLTFKKTYTVFIYRKYLA